MIYIIYERLEAFTCPLLVHRFLPALYAKTQDYFRVEILILLSYFGDYDFA